MSSRFPAARIFSNRPLALSNLCSCMALTQLRSFAQPVQNQDLPCMSILRRGRWFLPCIVVRVLITCCFNGLAGECLRLPASFSSFNCFLAAQAGIAMKTGCGNRKTSYPTSDRAARGAALYTQKNSYASTAPILCNYFTGLDLKIQQLVVTAHNSIANHFCRPALLRLPIRIKRFLHARAAIAPWVLSKQLRRLACRRAKGANAGLL